MLLCLLYVVIFLAAGYLLNLPLILLKIFLLTLCIFFVFAYWAGGQIVLAAVKAQRLSPGLFQHKVDNISCLLGMSPVQVYRSKGLPLGVYVLKGVGDSSHILFGGDVFEHFSPEEINALLYLSILRAKRLNLRFVQGCNFFFFVISLPVILMRGARGLRYLCLAMEFFLLPLKCVRDLAFRDEGQLLENSIKKLGIEEMENIARTVLFKLKSFFGEYSWDAHYILLSGLSLVEKEL